MEENKMRDYVWIVKDDEIWNEEDTSEDIRAFRDFDKAKELWRERVKAAENDWKESFGEENYGPDGSDKKVLFIKNEEHGIYESWLKEDYLISHITICIDKLFVD